MATAPYRLDYGFPFPNPPALAVLVNREHPLNGWVQIQSSPARSFRGSATLLVCSPEADARANALFLRMVLSCARLPTDAQPEFRNLRIYADRSDDPRAGESTWPQGYEIRFEKLSQKGAAQDKDAIGFFGRRLEVIDVDASGPRPAWLKPVILDDANIAMQRLHQAMGI